MTGHAMWSTRLWSVHTLALASAHALTTTPTVKLATAANCTGLYLFPHSLPTVKVVTLPKLLSMICIGTDI